MASSFILLICSVLSFFAHHFSSIHSSSPQSLFSIMKIDLCIWKVLKKQGDEWHIPWKIFSVIIDLSQRWLAFIKLVFYLGSLYKYSVLSRLLEWLILIWLLKYIELISTYHRLNVPTSDMQPFLLQMQQKKKEKKPNWLQESQRRMSGCPCYI